MNESESRPAPVSSGMSEQVRTFLSSIAGYFSARLRLATLEGKEAAGHVLKLLLAAGVALIFVVFGWLFLCLGVVFLIATAIGGEHSWLWATLGMAVVHLLGATALGFFLKSQIGTPIFPATIEELKKDQEWLDHTNSKNQP